MKINDLISSKFLDSYNIYNLPLHSRNERQGEKVALLKRKVESLKWKVIPPPSPPDKSGQALQRGKR